MMHPQVLSIAVLWWVSSPKRQESFHYLSENQGYPGLVQQILYAIKGVNALGGRPQSSQHIQCDFALTSQSGH